MWVFCRRFSIIILRNERAWLAPFSVVSKKGMCMVRNRIRTGGGETSNEISLQETSDPTNSWRLPRQQKKTLGRQLKV